MNYVYFCGAMLVLGCFAAFIFVIALCRSAAIGDEPKPKYYTPPDIVEMAAGSGAFLKDTTDKIIGNPPYGKQDEP